MLRIGFLFVVIATVSLAHQPCVSNNCGRRRCHCQSEITQLTQKIEGLETRVIQLTTASATTVAFAAKESATSTYGYLSTINFDAVITNIGGAFNARTGVFTAPKDGSYFFAVNILSDTNIQVDISLRQNNVGKCSAYARPGVHETGTCEIVLHLRSGDRVQVVAGPNLPGLRYHGRHTFFSGFLIGLKQDV